MGFELTHMYALTEVCRSATVCAKHEDWGQLDTAERAQLNLRQGVRYHMQYDARVLDSEIMQPVPMDGETIGEILFRRNAVMKGYLGDPKATQEAPREGWFHSSDLTMQLPDGCIKIKDRSKDIIILGGKNVSSLRWGRPVPSPGRTDAAVVAIPDPKWGKTPCALIEFELGAEVSEADIANYCKQQMAGFKVLRTVAFGELSKTSTGKIQKYELRQKTQSATATDL